ncbi:uncharacterized protein LOC113303700 [Papaver somniferum]|uniref:uncharacterized protein LOC113303700 n=1 Tax=Papaver somniferum TaxID=3469 RepID=UPI000E6F56D3|nr:uncharacterized protein LOC113303700 [Papaver somniferum]
MRRFRIFDYSLREEASAVVFLPLVKAILCSLSILKGANGRTGKEWKKLLPYLRIHLGQHRNVVNRLFWAEIPVSAHNEGNNHATFLRYTSLLSIRTCADGRMVAWTALAQHRNSTNTLSLVQNKHLVLTFMVVAQDLSGIVSSWNYLRRWCNMYLSALHKERFLGSPRMNSHGREHFLNV